MNVISFVLLIKNKANNVFPHAFMTLVHLTLATIAFTASETHLNILTIMGAYIILIGLTLFRMVGVSLFLNTMRTESGENSFSYLFY